jgi:multiple sugar transport system substrate-binding protein
MSDAIFQGLTWDHPRGYRALEAAAARDAPAILQWSRQPLEGFESHPIADLAARYDLLVLDHPHLGEAIAEDCLQPVEDWFPRHDLLRIAAETVGPAYASYAWNGRHYALPLDVATQVMARDPLRLPEPPDTWDDVEAAAQTMPVALSLAGPHAILTFLSLCVSLGEPPGDEAFVSMSVAREAMGRLRRLARLAPAGSDALNPIGLLETMATIDAIALVPLVYGYVPYATTMEGRRRIAFSEAPRMAPGGRRGSVLGGTGIGLTRRARPSRALVRHLSWLMSREAQSTFIPEHSGQPSNRAAWTDDAVNRAAGDFYRATLATAEGAYLRPRFDGWIAFQTEASERIREAILQPRVDEPLLTSLRALWHATCAKARGAIDG